jgi:hypothetical protein
MNRALAATLAVFLFLDPAEAQPYSRTVSSGKTSTVFTYTPWDLFCHSAPAVAKLIVKPKHGTVSHYLTSATIPKINRLTGAETPCAGKPATGFVVTYTSASGFRGVDTFILDVDYPSSGRHATDVFTITVQ